MPIPLKTALRVVIILIAVILVIAIAYFIYVMRTYHRLKDRLTLEVMPSQKIIQPCVRKGQNYSIMTYNIGFGAYTPEFSFFMDGGQSSWAKSKESVVDTITGTANLISLSQVDFALVQEIDTDSTRSYHVNELELLREQMPDMQTAYAVNYDSPFLFYPFHQPHGICRAGLATFSRYQITSALRRSFPISTSLSKLVDLDRCYSVNRIAVEGGRELILMNLHMSAYGNSDEIRNAQIQMLLEDMKKEYEAGNYVIVGGDFNHELKVQEADDGQAATWSHIFPRQMLPAYYTFAMDELSKEQKEALATTSRCANAPYDPATAILNTLDGFLISDNVEMLSYETMDEQFRYSDHNPVRMEFVLME